MGVLSWLPVWADLTVSLVPPMTQVKTFENTTPWVLVSLYFCYIAPHVKFWNPRKTFQNTPLFRPKSVSFFIGILVFCHLGAHATFHDPMTTPSGSGRMSREPRKRRRERKKMLKTATTSAPLAPAFSQCFPQHLSDFHFHSVDSFHRKSDLPSL